MQQIPIYFKSDFKLFIRTEAGFAVPFKFEFYTNVPSRPFVVKFDGYKYYNCSLMEDGRLCVAFDDHNMGLGKLMIKQSYYLNDTDYKSEICDRVIAPQPVINIDDHEMRSEIVLSLNGDDTIEFTSQLPPYYQSGLTPEEHQALIEATAHAEEAAGQAEGAASNADKAREKLTAAYNARVAALQQDYDTTKANLAAEYSGRLAALQADYNATKDNLSGDYAATKSALDANYNATKNALAVDYTAKKSALDADYAATIANLNNAYAAAIAEVDARMTAIESDYASDKEAWNTAVAALLVKFQSDFDTAEAEREARVSQAIANAEGATGAANTAAGAANAAATKAGNVNAVLNGDNITVTDQNGNSVTRNVRGPKGDSITMFPNVTIFGQPTIQESQISGFTAQNYVQFPFLVDFAGRPWQLDCSITTGADVSQQHNVFDSAFGLAFAFSGGKFVLAMSSNGTSWDLGATSGTHSILANTTYYIRISWDGSVYKLAYSTNKETWVDDIVVTSSASLASKQIVIGKSLDNRYIFNGSINMSDAHLTISGKIVWEGMDDAGLATRMAIDLSNIDDEGKARVNEVAMAGEVGQKLGDLSAKTEDITHEEIATKDDSIDIEDNDGNNVLHIDNNGVNAKNLKSNGKEVLTEHQSLSEYAKKTDIPDVSIFATQSEVESKQDKIEQIEQGTTSSNVQKFVLASDDYDEEQGTGEKYADANPNGVMAKRYTNLDGNRMDTSAYDIVFASFNSLPEHKAKADIICGEDDAQEKIQTAINNWYSNHPDSASGRFLFFGGTYYITHFVEPTGDDVNGTPYGILMPKGNGATVCTFEGENEIYTAKKSTMAVFEVKTDAYILKADGTHASLTDFKSIQGVFAEYEDKPNRYLIDNKRYSVIRCASNPTKAGYSQWCAYNMILKRIKIHIGNDSNRTLTNYPIIGIDALYTSNMVLEECLVSAVEMHSPSNHGADNYNEGFTGIRCMQGQTLPCDCRMNSVGVAGFYHGIEFGGEHWTICNLAVLSSHVGIAFCCYHDTYGCGHPNVFENLTLELNYYPMYFYYNGSGWVGGTNLNINSMGVEWYKYVYGGEKTEGAHIEHYNNSPKGEIRHCVPATDGQFFDIESQSKVIGCVLEKATILKNHLYHSDWGDGVEHGIKASIGENGQMVYLTDKHCFALWNNADKTLTNFGSWVMLQTTTIV